jgi:hypothetical protein
MGLFGRTGRSGNTQDASHNTLEKKVAYEINCESLKITGKSIPKLLIENLVASYWCFFTLLSVWFLFEFFHIQSLSSDRTIFLLGVTLLSASLFDASTILPAFAASKIQGERQIYDICQLLASSESFPLFKQNFSAKSNATKMCHEIAQCAKFDISNSPATEYWINRNSHILIRNLYNLGSLGRDPPRENMLLLQIS